MLEAIGQARSTIRLETFIFHDDEMERLVPLLAAHGRGRA
jgi:hypothetical protein